MPFHKKRTLQHGQAVVEMCVCVVAVLVIFLGLIYVGGLGLSNIQRLLKAKTNAETGFKPKDNAGDSEDMFAWDYRNLQRQQRQTFEPDAFQGSHLFSPYRTSSISGLPSAANDRIINKSTAAVANQDSPLFQTDFQSTFLRELIPASQIKRSDSAANNAFRNIPPLFVGAEETVPQDADESVSDANSGSLIKGGSRDASAAVAEKQTDRNSAELLRGQPSSKRIKKNSSGAVVKP
ncbi:MAG: hypothetical protein ACYC4Q_02270 [Victivallaceae bacterium]